MLGLTAIPMELQTTDVSRWVPLAQQGDTEAFGEICRAYEGRLLRQAMTLCGDVSLAEDVAQDTWVEAWKSIRRFQGRCQFFTWLCAILLNRSRNAARRRRPMTLTSLPQEEGAGSHLEELIDPQTSPDGAAQRIERAALLEAAISRLSAKHREVVCLRFFADDSLEGIAAALDCSVGTVKSRLFHALDNLRLMAEHQKRFNDLSSL